MQSQKSDEEIERSREIEKDWKKACQFPNSILGRKRLRELRHILYHLGINLHIPMNSAYVTDEYCRNYGKDEVHIKVVLGGILR